MLTGSVTTLVASFAAGAVGAILAFANPGPRACVEVYRASQAGDHAAAKEAQRLIARPGALISSKYGIPGLKHMMDVNGYYGGPVRLPLLPLTPAARAEIEIVFSEVKGLSHFGHAELSPRDTVCRAAHPAN